MRKVKNSAQLCYHGANINTPDYSPMGVKVAPDIFQQVINNLFSDLDFVPAYLDDILITSSDSFQDHLEKLDIFLHRLTEAGFRANLRKCFLAKDELDYLGYWLSRDGIQPQPKKWKRY